MAFASVCNLESFRDWIKSRNCYNILLNNEQNQYENNYTTFLRNISLNMEYKEYD